MGEKIGFAVFYVIAKLISFLPFWIVYRISDITFFLMFYVFRYRRKVVESNLEKAFPDKSNIERERISRQYYQHLCDISLELIMMQSVSLKQIEKRCYLPQEKVLSDLIKDGHPMFFLTGHFGNYEWAGFRMGMLSEHPVKLVYKPLSSKPFEKWFKDLRIRFGNKAIPMRSIVKEMLATPENLIASFLADQTPSGSESSEWLTFLNQETLFFNGVEKLVRKMDASVVFATMHRIKRGHYHIDLEVLTEHAAQTKEGEITEKYVRAMERSIHRHPYNWLWSHRRWKHSRQK